MFGVADILMIGCSEFLLPSMDSWDCVVLFGSVGSVIWRFPIRSSFVISSGGSDSEDSDSSVDSSVPSPSSSCSPSGSSSSSEDSVLPSSSDSSSCPSRGSSGSSSSWSLCGGDGDSRQIRSSFSVVKLRAHF